MFSKEKELDTKSGVDVPSHQCDLSSKGVSMGRLAKFTVFVISFLAFTAGDFSRDNLRLMSLSPAADEGYADVKNRIDLSAYTDMRGSGYLSSGQVISKGVVKEAQSGFVLIGKGDRIYVSLAEGESCTSGRTLTVGRVRSEVRSPATGQPAGFVVDFLGTARLEGLIAEYGCAAVLTESFVPIAAGDILMEPRGMEEHCIEPALIEKEIGATILAAKESMDMISQFSVVYLNAGSSVGLTRGMIMNIYEGRPDIIIGHLIITDVYPETATAVVTDTLREFHPGAKTRASDKRQVEQVLRKASLCSPERGR